MTDFIFVGSKITADGDCSHEIKRCLLLGIKAMTNLNSILKKQRHLLTKVCLVKAMVFPAVMHGCERWTIMKVGKNWCFWIMGLEKTLESPLDYKRSNQSILKEINPEYSLKGLMPKLKLQYFSHLMWRADSLEKTLMLGMTEGRRRGRRRGWDGWMASPTWIWVWASPRSWWWTGKPGMLQSMGSQRVGHDWATRLNWTECSTFTA